ncbi:hypothetical protein HYALB_00007557 [Hymenoscyphus albidus]|uniref:Uncharacterized protein n=1 Tax=Hymenoscyphus albidus TaxID=595503 RepID=A0A9N9LMY7_9HELO|nr:hypothetical protein HYALB_00007557 [Hymenoscyphus albidus]
MPGHRRGKKNHKNASKSSGSMGNRKESSDRDSADDASSASATTSPSQPPSSPLLQPQHITDPLPPEKPPSSKLPQTSSLVAESDDQKTGNGLSASTFADQDSGADKSSDGKQASVDASDTPIDSSVAQSLEKRLYGMLMSNLAHVAPHKEHAQVTLVSDGLSDAVAAPLTSISSTTPVENDAAVASAEGSKDLEDSQEVAQKSEDNQLPKVVLKSSFESHESDTKTQLVTFGNLHVMEAEGQTGSSEDAGPTSTVVIISGTPSSLPYPERLIKPLPTLSKARARAGINNWLHAPMQTTYAITTTANPFASKEAPVTPSASDAAKGRPIKPLPKRSRKFLGVANRSSSPTVSDLLCFCFFTFRASSEVSPVAETFSERNPSRTHALLQQPTFNSTTDATTIDISEKNTGMFVSKYASESALDMGATSHAPVTFGEFTNFPTPTHESLLSFQQQSSDSVVNKYLAEYTGEKTGISVSKYAKYSAAQSYAMTLNMIFAPSKPSLIPQSLSLTSSYFAALSQGLENSALASNNVFTLAVAKSVIPDRGFGPAPYLENVLGKPVNPGGGTEADDDTEAINEHKEESGVKEDDGGDEEKGDEHEGNEVEQPTVITTRPTVLNTESSEKAPSSATDEELVQSTDGTLDPGHKVTLPLLCGHSEGKPFEENSEPAQSEDFEKQLRVEVQNDTEESAVTVEKSAVIDVEFSDGDNSPVASHSLARNSEDITTKVNDPNHNHNGTVIDPSLMSILLDVRGIISKVQSRNRTATAMIERLQNELRATTETTARLETESQGRKVEIGTNSEEIERLKDNFRTTTEKTTRLETEDKGLRDQIASLTQQMKILETENKRLDSENSTNAGKIESLGDELKVTKCRLETENKRLNTENETNAGKVESLETILSMTKYRRKTKNKGLEVQLANLMKKMKELQAENKTLRVVKNIQTTNITSLSSSVERLKADNLELRSILRTARRISESKSQRLRASNNRPLPDSRKAGCAIMIVRNSEQIASETTDRETENATLREESSQQKTELGNLNSKNDALQHRIGENESEIETLKLDIITLRDEPFVALAFGLYTAYLTDGIPYSVVLIPYFLVVVAYIAAQRASLKVALKQKVEAAGDTLSSATSSSDIEAPVSSTHNFFLGLVVLALVLIPAILAYLYVDRFMVGRYFINIACTYVAKGLTYIATKLTAYLHPYIPLLHTYITKGWNHIEPKLTAYLRPHIHNTFPTYITTARTHIVLGMNFIGPYLHRNVRPSLYIIRNIIDPIKVFPAYGCPNVFGLFDFPRCIATDVPPPPEYLVSITTTVVSQLQGI